MTWLRTLSYAASGIVVLILWWLWSDRQALQIANKDLAQELSAAQEAAAQAREAARVLSAHLRRESAARAEHETELRELREMEGYDAPLSGFLSGAADRL